MRFLHYTQLRFVPVEMTYKKTSLLNGFTLIVNKLQILLKNEFKNCDFVISNLKIILDNYQYSWLNDNEKREISFRYCFYLVYH